MMQSGRLLALHLKYKLYITVYCLSDPAWQKQDACLKYDVL